MQILIETSLSWSFLQVGNSFFITCYIHTPKAQTSRDLANPLIFGVTRVRCESVCEVTVHSTHARVHFIHILHKRCHHLRNAIMTII